MEEEGGRRGSSVADPHNAATSSVRDYRGLLHKHITRSFRRFGLFVCLFTTFLVWVIVVTSHQHRRLDTCAAPEVSRTEQ